MKSKYGRIFAISIGVMLLCILLWGVLVINNLNNKAASEINKNTLALQKEHKEKSDINNAKQEDSHEKTQNELIPFDEAQIKQAGIVIERAGAKLIRSITKLNGEIKFNEDRTAHVVPRLTGIVESVSADMGQQVHQGQVLAVISSVQLSELRSDLLSTQKKKELAQITFDREKKLWQEKISSEQDYLQAQQNLSELNIALQNASQKLSALGAKPTTTGMLSRYELRAPFDGMVVEKHIALGEAVKEDANVFTISDLSTVWAEIIIPAQSLDAVRVGEKAVVKATSMGSVSEGKITFVGSLLGEQTRAAKARVTLKNPNMAWRPGLFVNVDLTDSENEVPVAVQSDAIQTIENHPTVFIKVNGGFMPRTVKIGRSDEKFSEITEGLEKDVLYAAAGSFVIKAEEGKNTASHGH